MAEYSTLKPETNSLSPSVKSNGGRLVSANADTKNMIKAGNNGNTYQISSCALTMAVKLRDPAHKITEIIIRPIETSYEIICAAALMAPKKAYLELLAQPDNRMA
jgi:hypothetical protein